MENGTICEQLVVYAKEKKQKKKRHWQFSELQCRFLQQEIYAQIDLAIF